MTFDNTDLLGRAVKNGITLEFLILAAHEIGPVTDGDNTTDGEEVAAALSNFEDLETALADNWSPIEREILSDALTMLDA